MQRLTHELEIAEVSEHRKETCLNYDTCLDEASVLCWVSFSCKGCENFINAGPEFVSYERACSPLAWDVR